MSILLRGEWSDQERAEWLFALREAAPQEHWVVEVAAGNAKSVDIAVVANPAPGSLQNLPGLQLIQSLWAGVDRLIVDPSLPPRVPIARMVDPLMNQAMAETALWAVLALQRDFFVYARQQRQARWQQWPQRRASDWPVLLLGLGEMGRCVARRLSANGYPVSGWSRNQAQIDGIQCLSGEAPLQVALGRSQVVINLLPLTAQTQGFFDAGRLASLRRGSHLVNLARGAHLVDADVLAALASGQLGELIVDPFTTEPLPGEHPFWRTERVTVLPHIAAQTDRRSAASVVANNIARLRSGQQPLYQVDRMQGY